MNRKYVFLYRLTFIEPFDDAKPFDDVSLSLSLSLSLCFFMLQQSYHIAHSSSHAIIMKLCMHPGVCGQSVHMHIYVYVHSFFFFLFFCDFGTGVNSCDQQTVIGKLHSLLSFHVDFVMIKSRHKIRHYIRHFEVGD